VFPGTNRLTKGSKGVFAVKNLAHGFTKSLLLLIIVGLVACFGVANVINPPDAQAQSSKYDGYLADVLCATRGTALDGADMVKHPEKHSVDCLKEPPCLASGFGVLVKGKDEAYAFHKFDKKGNELAVQLINKTAKKDGVSVEVTGQMIDGIINVQSIAEK
jgi:hypothetical protein